MSSGCYLALHVNVSVAGCYNPGPEIKCWGGWCYFCVEGISREALRLVTIRIQLRARVSVTARLIFVTALDGFYFISPFSTESWLL